MEQCPCLSGKTFHTCCEPFLKGEKNPKNPEELMRSRYTAYTKADVAYIEATMRGPALVDFNKEHAEHWAKQLTWHGLKVIQSRQEEDQGAVEFIAHYSSDGNRDTIYEISEFHEIEGKWYYFDGATPKIGRNENCPCKSQKKFKKCCGS